MGEDSDILTSRGAARFYLDDLQGSKDDFTQALELDEENVRAMNNRAVVEFCLEEYEAAKDDYAKAIEHIPSERLLLGGMALTLHAMDNEDDKAVEIWKGLIQLDPRFRDAQWTGQEMLWPEPMVNETKKLIARI